MNGEADLARPVCDLSGLKASLPAELYYEDAVYRSELEQLWYKTWLYVCRCDAIAQAGDYRLFQIGTQSIIVVRDAHNKLNAFHNSCPHRGSILCENQAGKFPGKRITCPYHRWTYSLSGQLTGVPFLDAGTSKKNITLYKVALQEWGGNIYINLDAESAPDFSKVAEPGFDVLKNWPLAELQVAHTHEYLVACNWKVFWENFVECYHCPGTHPELCGIVPLYNQSYTWPSEELAAAGLQEGLKAGVESWTQDGRSHWPAFDSLTEAEKAAGHTFLTLLPAMFMVAHLDYVRQVSIVPQGPEQISVRTEWLFGKDTLAVRDFDKTPAVEFVSKVLQQDAKVCELNQKGLKALAFKQGRLVPQEAEVYVFQQWYRTLMQV